jgi:uncharacterized protein YndB with AHSA1/START domain
MRIEQTYQIRATPTRVWAALTDPTLMANWSGQPAVYDGRKGGRYRLWADYVTGRVVIWEPPRRLAQTWKPVDWTIENSVVTFVLKPTRGGTRLDLIHENVQPEDYEGTTSGWNDFYVGPLRRMLEAETLKPKPKAQRQALRAKKPAKKAAVKKRVTAKRATGTKHKKKPPMKRNRAAAKRSIRK